MSKLSIGGSTGSGEINSTSIGLGQQGSFNPVSGVSAGKKGWGSGGQGAPAPEYGTKGNVAGTVAPTSKRKSPAPSIGNINMASGKTKPSRTER